MRGVEITAYTASQDEDLEPDLRERLRDATLRLYDLTNPRGVVLGHHVLELLPGLTVRAKEIGRRDLAGQKQFPYRLSLEARQDFFLGGRDYWDFLKSPENGKPLFPKQQNVLLYDYTLNGHREDWISYCYPRLTGKINGLRREEWPISNLLDASPSVHRETSNLVDALYAGLDHWYALLQKEPDALKTALGIQNIAVASDDQYVRLPRHHHVYTITEQRLLPTNLIK